MRKVSYKHNLIINKYTVFTRRNHVRGRPARQESEEGTVHLSPWHFRYNPAAVPFRLPNVPEQKWTNGDKIERKRIYWNFRTSTEIFTSEGSEPRQNDNSCFLKRFLL